jgi:hypothetical protein
MIIGAHLEERRDPDRGRRSSSRVLRDSSFCEGKSAGGWPPTLPRLRAASSPSRVRSEIRSRSNCAMEAKTWNVRRPAGVVVSMSSASERKPAPRSLIGVHDLEQVLERAREPVVLGHHHDVALAELVEEPVELGARAQRAADLVGEDAARSRPVSASSWASRFCSPVDTRAYPRIMDMNPAQNLLSSGLGFRPDQLLESRKVVWTRTETIDIG